MFHSLIKEIWSTTPGLDNVMLSGVDGIVIARHHESEKDDIVAAEAASLVKDVQKFGGELEAGNLKSLCAHYEDMMIAIQMVTAEYLLLGVVKDPQYLGLVQYRFTLKSYEWYSAIA
ncbi:Roadblock/LC7 domain-containing protein [Sulfidibacter corallicola]|uniref:Roadblock/LC7 domain-containing protein n=1 Tax=Sulfidibacter corallicola TaxID=2818388 RepID=A0A8A4TU65_SULCO|nr:roadblock/LC7 domain-containing protein [Sulfidibacter corallicola]QTD53013.1 roadblock/LC7 domain-containing protein [Sulfidibacter corallicola]